MEQTIKITAEPQQHDRTACKFTVDRVLLKDGSIRFRTAAEAKDSPLAARLFSVEGVTSVMIQAQTVTVTVRPPVDWRAIGPQIGAAIRAHVASGDMAVKPEAFQNVSKEDQFRQKIQTILDEQINPAVASHGGYITLVDVKNTDIYIQMGGGCQGCGQAGMTLRSGVEEALRSQIPELGQIFDATDHDAGENPYISATRDNDR